MLYARRVELAEDVAYSLKTPFSQATRSHPGKKSYEPKAMNETMLPIIRKKSITISRTQYRTTPIHTLISTKKKRMRT